MTICVWSSRLSSLHRAVRDYGSGTVALYEVMRYWDEAILGGMRRDATFATVAASRRVVSR